MIHFEIPENPGSIIKIIGVGGGGSNAVTHMQDTGAEGLDLIICNTDSQALTNSSVANKIQLGPHLTQGLGAGANPSVGEKAAEESIEELKRLLEANAKMVFITAGMGGGTGTGGAPIIAKLCKEMDILTVAIVTTPFFFEGRKRMKYAMEGINKLKENVDTIIVISNDKLREQCGDLTFVEAFSKADDILANAATCITNVIHTNGRINTDFADVNTVMREGGVAILGNAKASGHDRAMVATEEAINSPLLNNNDIEGANWVLINVSSSQTHAHTMDELGIIQNYIEDQAGDDCNVILGMGIDETLGDELSVTIIATGFSDEIEGPIEDVRKAKANRSKEVLNLNDEVSNTPNTQEAKKNEILETSEPTANQETDKIVLDSEANKLEPTMLEPTLSESKEDEVKKETEKIYLDLNADGADNSNTLEIGKMLYSENEEEESVEDKIESDILNQDTPAEREPQTPEEKLYKEFNIPEVKGIRVLTKEEREELLKFEMQKRQLEDRALGLFSLKNTIEIENSDSIPSAEEDDPSYLSGFRVTKEDINNNKLISSINNYLHGKKPD